MSDTKNKGLWISPWGYPESMLIVSAILLSGYALQIKLDCFDFFLLRWPVNGFVGVLILLSSLILGFFHKSRFVTWFSGVSFSVSLLFALFFLTLLMGFTMQVDSKQAIPHSIISMLGIDRMTRSWPFVLLYLTMLLCLGSLLVSSLIHFDKTRYAFYFNHLGLWLLLLFMGLGTADLHRYVMHVQIKDDNPEWRVYNENQEVLELPIAIYLNDFSLEEYEPKLTIINKKDGKSLPLDLPQYFQIDKKSQRGQLLDWKLEVLQFFPEAVRSSEQAFKPISMPGSAPAAKVRMTHMKSKVSKEAWVSCGSFAQLYRKLDLDSNTCLVMTLPEPKKFVSDVIIYSQHASKPDSAIIEVNKPFSHHNWMVYQYSYDENLGKASAYSSFELVYDPWKKFVYLAFLLLAFGSFALFWKHAQKTGKKK